MRLMSLGKVCVKLNHRISYAGIIRIRFEEFFSAAIFRAAPPTDIQNYAIPAKEKNKKNVQFL